MDPYTGQATKRRALPLDRTVRWLPLHDAYYLLAEVMTSTRAVPLVVMQEALLEVEAHASSEVYGSTCGILCGDQYRDSKSGVSYLLVEGIERAARMDRDGDPDASLAADLSRAIARAERTGRTVVGWYRFDVPLSHHIPTTDAGIHRALFPEPWQVALLRDGSEGEGRGAFIRVEPNEGRPFPIPFIELIPRKRARGRGPKRTSIQWRSYSSESPVVALPVEVFHDAPPRHAKKPHSNGAPPSAPRSAHPAASPGASLADVFARWSARRAAAKAARPIIPRAPGERVVTNAAQGPRVDEDLPPTLHTARSTPPEELYRAPEELGTSAEVLKAPAENPAVPREDPQAPAAEPEAPAEWPEAAVWEPEELAEEPESRVEEPESRVEEREAPAAEREAPLEETEAPVEDIEIRAEPPETAHADLAAAAEDTGSIPDDRASIPDDPVAPTEILRSPPEEPVNELDALFTEWRPDAHKGRARGTFSAPWNRPVSRVAVKRAIAAVALIGVGYIGVQRVRDVRANRGGVATSEAPVQQSETREEASGRLADAGTTPSANGRPSDGSFTPEERADVRSALARISDSRTALAAHLDTLETALATTRSGTGDGSVCARAGSLYRSSLDDLAQIDLARQKLSSLVGPMRMAGIDSLSRRASDLHPRLRDICPR